MFNKILIILAFFMTGCQFISPIGPIIQAGLYWLEGEAHKYYNTEEKVMRKATLDVLKELKIPIIKEEDYKEYHYIVAGDGDKFKIKIRAVRENITKISIRVNTMGDRPYAELIYRHLDEKPGIRQFSTTEELNTAMEKSSRK